MSRLMNHIHDCSVYEDNSKDVVLVGHMLDLVKPLIMIILFVNSVLTISVSSLVVYRFLRALIQNTGNRGSYHSNINSMRIGSMCTSSCCRLVNWHNEFAAVMGGCTWGMQLFTLWRGIDQGKSTNRCM